jgi:methanogenic corrinoid protein MtbC1
MMTWSIERSAPLNSQIRELALMFATRYHEVRGRRETPSSLSPLIEEAECHLCYLAEAITAGRASLFADYVAWWKSVLMHRAAAPTEVRDALELLRESLREHLPSETAKLAGHYIETAIAHAEGLTLDLPTFFRDELPLVEYARTHLHLLLAGRQEQATERLKSLLIGGTSLTDIYSRVLEISQAEIGRLWQLNRISVAQEHYCTEASRRIMTCLMLLAARVPPKGRTVVAAAVDGEQHDLGIQMIAESMELDGRKSYFLGADTPGVAVVQFAKTVQPDVVALSATMPIYLHAAARTVVALKQALPQVQVVVGGDAFAASPEVFSELGADLYVAEGAAAVIAINALFRNSHPTERKQA